MKSHIAHDRSIRALPKTELNGIFFLDNTELTNSLLPGPTRCLSHLRVALPPFFRKYANGVLEKLSLANRDMSSVCRTVAEYVTQLESVKQVEDLFDVVEKEVVKINGFYDFLKAKGFLAKSSRRNDNGNDNGKENGNDNNNISDLDLDDDPRTNPDSSFSTEDMLAQAINQEMQQVSERAVSGALTCLACFCSSLNNSLAQNDAPG